MDLTLIPPRAPDGSVHVLVEIPRGSRNNYEYDSELGVIALDRVLYSPVHYPTDYGFVPGTLGTDGEPLDALVMVEEPTFPGCLVRVRPLGVLTIESSSGRREQKLLGVPVGEPRFAEYGDIGDVPPHLLKEIEHFFEVFKDLEGSATRPVGWEGAAGAQAALDRAVEGSGPSA
jgi:inorganic pyrophosphatase